MKYLKKIIAVVLAAGIGEYEVNPAFISDVERRYQFALSAFNGCLLYTSRCV